MKKLYLPIFILTITAATLFLTNGPGRAAEDSTLSHPEEIGLVKGSLRPADNLIYIDYCSGCHDLYLPGLLPSSSWRRILFDLDTHCNKPPSIEQVDLMMIEGYLVANAAEKDGSNHSKLIVESLAGAIPMHIFEVPYIKEAHDSIADVFKRKSVGNRAHCSACHHWFEMGDFGPGHTSIPK